MRTGLRQQARTEHSVYPEDTRKEDRLPCVESKLLAWRWAWQTNSRVVEQETLGACAHHATRTKMT